MIKAVIMIMYLSSNGQHYFAPSVYFDSMAECKTKAKGFERLAKIAEVKVNATCYDVVE